MQAEFEAKLGQQLQQQQQQQQQQHQQLQAEFDTLKLEHQKSVNALTSELKRCKTQHERDIEQLINSNVTAATMDGPLKDDDDDDDDEATQAAALTVNIAAIDADEAAPLRLLKIPLKASNDNVLQ